MKYLSRLLGRIMIGAARFPVTFGWCALLFLVFSWAVFLEEDHAFLYPLEAAGFAGAALSVVFALAAERSGRYSWTPWLSVTLAGGVYRVYPPDFPLAYLWMTAGGMVLGCLAVSLYLLWTRERGGSLFPFVLTGMMKSVGAALLFGLSLTLCFTALRTLLVSSLSFDWYFVIWHAALFLVGVPLFLAWLPSSAEPARLPPLLRQLTLRLLLPVYGMLLAILLCYVGTITAAWDMPVGEMNWFASLAVLGYAFFYFTLSGDTFRARRRLFLLGALLLIPIVAAQLVGVYIRLDAYGATPARYASLFCTFFGILVLLTGAAGKSVRFLYPTAAVLIFLATMSPWNLIDLPMRDQQYRIQTVLSASGMIKDGEITAPDSEISKEDKEKLVSGYHYFRYSVTTDTNAFSHQIADSEVLQSMADRQADSRYIEIQWNGPIPIEGWKTLQDFQGIARAGQMDIVVNGENETVDMGDFWETVFDEHKDGPGRQDALLSYDTGTRRFLFRRVSFMNEGDGARTFHVEGYVLEKSK